MEVIKPIKELLKEMVEAGELRAVKTVESSARLVWDDSFTELTLKQSKRKARDAYTVITAKNGERWVLSDAPMCRALDIHGPRFETLARSFALGTIAHKLRTSFDPEDYLNVAQTTYDTAVMVGDGYLGMVRLPAMA